MQRLDWDNLRVLLAVVRTGNLRIASARLRLSSATLSRRLDTLEEQLGGKLVERTSTGCETTALGLRIATWAEQMEGSANEILREADTPEEIEGTVRINADEWLCFLLTSLIPPLHQRHPALHIEILASQYPFNLARREADISLRYGKPETGDLLGKRLGQIEFGLYANQTYVDAHAVAIHNRQWQALDFIGLDESRADQTMDSWLNALPGAPQPWLRGNNALSIYDGVHAGAGLGLMAEFTAHISPSFCRVLDAPELSREVWLCVHRSLRENARVDAVIEFLEEVWPA
ncbi:LysR family transcriptional regulator [Amantichitinum ursilacus]|uniref:HTH-type transcriptional regulator BenM n=1 Tax=Amantichitinum ursilacus TaxID=857265 RepID=A0A0N0XIA8_9NEIS|nr:LysR family transcriptional regulator [Amantichitinum ursilacus]KPC52517.1 HTH-type transcriptional regulator BenM [Amantichitinum ursilacus]